jgi:CheY-like chemotaxis protein
MRPSEARILHVDDSEFARLRVAEAAADIGASVVGSAASFEEAKDALRQIEDLGVNVVLTDDTLSPEKPYEGRYVYDIVHAEHPEVHVLSVSATPSMSQDLRIPHVSDKGTDPAILKAAIEAL